MRRIARLMRNSADVRAAAKTLAFGVLVLVLLSGAAFGSWDDAKGRGIFPYWSTGGPWLTLFVFVNVSEDAGETIYLELINWIGESAPPRGEFQVAAGEMLIVSTSPCVGEFLPVMPGVGYGLFRCQHGGLIYPLCAVVNVQTGGGYTVRAYHEDEGF